MKKITITVLTSLTLLLASQITLANDEQKGPSGRRGPPPEAFTACEGKSAGDTAQFEGRRGDTVTGTCEVRDGKLVLRPERGNRPERPARSE